MIGCKALMVKEKQGGDMQYITELAMLVCGMPLEEKVLPTLLSQLTYCGAFPETVILGGTLRVKW